MQLVAALVTPFIFFSSWIAPKAIVNRTPVNTPRPTINNVQFVTTRPLATAISKPPTASSIPTNSNVDFLIDQVNEYRALKGLIGVKNDSYSCDFAKIRAGEITTNFSHDGFNTRAKNNTLPYPSWHEVTENIAMNSNPNAVVNAWINSPSHAANMLKNTPYVCIQKNDNFYAYEGYKP